MSLSSAIQKIVIDEENWEKAIQNCEQYLKLVCYTRDKPLMGIFWLTAAPGHPSSHSQFGSLQDEDLREKVQKFHRQHYVANKMFLSIESTQSLDEMQKLVVKYFAGIPASSGREVAVPTILKFDHENAFTPSFTEKMFYVEAKEDKATLHLTWCLPSEVQNYRCKPQEHVRMLLKNGAPGSLISYLQKNFLATRVDSGPFRLTHQNSIFSLFRISVDLTEKGLKNIQTVLKAIFDYLLFIKKSGVDQIRENLEDFKLRFGHFWLDRSDCLALYPPKDILKANKLFEFDEEEILAVIEALNRPKFNLLIVGGEQEFEKYESLMDFKYSKIGEFYVFCTFFQGWKPFQILCIFLRDGH
jgi:nardilysin